MTIGIYGFSSQSGKAFLVDYLAKGYDVIGYTRATEHGQAVIDYVHTANGLYLERPVNKNNENTKFVTLTPNSKVTSVETPYPNCTFTFSYNCYSLFVEDIG